MSEIDSHLRILCVRRHFVRLLHLPNHQSLHPPLLRVRRLRVPAESALSGCHCKWGEGSKKWVGFEAWWLGGKDGGPRILGFVCSALHSCEDIDNMLVIAVARSLGEG